MEDEGYYLCKVMAEPQSLKHVVYVKVNVDLRVVPHNPLNVKLDETIVITCNTSYEMVSHSSSSSTSSLSQNQNQNKFLNTNNKSKLTKTLPTQQNSPTPGQPQQQQQPRLLWYKDGEHFSINDHQHQSQSFIHEHGINSSGNGGSSTRASNIVNYRIEYYAKPVLWSRIVFKSFKAHNIGKYTCKFRSQNLSTILSPYLGEKLFIFYEYHILEGYLLLKWDRIS